jgi:ribosomal protein S18 acetylase RimI-like enzyme
VAHVLTTPTDEHLQETLRWLKEEEKTTGGGFYCNRRVISNAFKDSLLHCLLESKLVLAFIVLGIHGAESEISIIEVHPEHRGRGFGTLLVKHSVSYLKARGASTVDVECAPPESELFWRGRGFADHPNPPFGSLGAVYLQMVLA